MKQQKHHYIPSFYTKRWAGDDRRLIEYRRGYGNRIYCRRTHPDGTGYVFGLNTVEGLPPQLANILEDGFLQRADDLACKTLDRFLTRDIQVDNDARSAWSRFLISLLHRAPERVRYLREQVNINYDQAIAEFARGYRERRRPGDPETFEEYRSKMSSDARARAYAIFFQDIVDSKQVGNVLNAMKWGFIELKETRFVLMTSDRPMVMTNGMTSPGSHLAMPISPKVLFVAANQMDTIHRINDLKEQLVARVNDFIVRQARKYVYASEPVELRYLEKRLGQRIIASPLKEASD